MNLLLAGGFTITHVNMNPQKNAIHAMFQNSVLAASMGTTLWFTPQDKAAGMPQAILAAGQYHICRSLLSYIHHIEKDPTNTSQAHSLLIACKPQLLQAWKRFKQDPLCMVPKV